MVFVHRRSKSENDKSALARAEPVHISDRDCGCVESSDDEDTGCDDQAAEPTWFPKATPATDATRHSDHSSNGTVATDLDQSTHGNYVPDSGYEVQPVQLPSSPQVVLSTDGSDGCQLPRPCHFATPATGAHHFTHGDCVLGRGPDSVPSHANYQTYYGQCYHPISTSFPHPQYAHPTPMPFPAYLHHLQAFYAIPEEAAGIHWQQHGGEERNRTASPNRGEGHGIRERRIYVGNLRYSATAEAIRQHLNHQGLSQGAQAIFMPRAGEGRNRGFCFVTYDSPERAQEAMEQLGGSDHLGRKLICRYSLPRGMRYEPNLDVRPESQAVPEARKQGNTGRPPVSPPNRFAPHRIPFEDVGADGYVVPPYDETKVFSPKRDWISAGACVVEVANLPPLPGEGACLREMELLFKGFDVTGICGPIPQYWCHVPFSPSVASKWCPNVAHVCHPQYCYVRLKTKAQARLAAQQLHNTLVIHGKTLRRLYICARWSLPSHSSV